MPKDSRWARCGGLRVARLNLHIYCVEVYIYRTLLQYATMKRQDNAYQYDPALELRPNKCSISGGNIVTHPEQPVVPKSRNTQVRTVAYMRAVEGST